MARLLADARIPVFRTADRALRLFGRWAAAGKALHPLPPAPSVP